MKVTRRTFLEVMTVAAAAAPAAARSTHLAQQSPFTLYAKIDRHREATRLADPDLPRFTALAVLPSAHPYFEFRSASAEIGEPGDTPVCC